MAEYRLEMKGVVKTFPGVKALDHVDFKLRPGSVHALMGENGAGKSTLMKCLFGIYRMDEGEIFYEGQKVQIKDPLMALNLGIAMVHQELQPITERSVAENIFVGRYPMKKLLGFIPVVDHEKMYIQTEELLKRVRMSFDPRQKLGTLSVSQMQSVEIAKAVSNDCHVLILDEPTSSLTEHEVEALFRIIDDLKAEGVSIIYISHKMEEILQREITKECYDFVTAIEGEYLYGLMNYPARNSEKIRKIVRSCFNQMLARNDYLGKTQLSLGLGSSVKEAENIKGSFVIANRSLAERLLEGNSKMLEADASNGVLYEKKLVDKFTRNLGSALQTLDVEEIRNTINVIYNETMETPGVHGWEILEMIRQCGSIFIMRLDVPDKAEPQKEFDNKCDNCVTVNALFTCLLDFMLTKVNQMIALREEDSVRPVRLAKQYIHNHYQEQITLEEVSDYVGLTPAYFSVMFKKETEIGFAKYLINERIEGAKDLLRESTLSVADICRKVGYNDPKHFTRLFEKNVGVKPAVYRKLYG